MESRANESSQDSHDQRRAPRHAAPALTAWLPALGVKAQVRDISSGGFALQFDAVPPAEPEQVVEFRVDGVLRILLRSRLAHCRGFRSWDGDFHSVAGFSCVPQGDGEEAMHLLIECAVPQALPTNR
jgi:hypothetical protein